MRRGRALVRYQYGIASDVLPSRYASPVLVARGGMGEVYRATDTVLSRTVAVKLLAERHAGDSDVRTRFEREARAAARLSGEPHVITVFDVGEHEGRPFIVMEYIDSGSVYDRLREGRVEPSQTLRWLSETAQALDVAHAHGVVHRDVKPANLLLDHDGDVHVSDFGIASAAGQDTLTLPGTVLGTVGYLSPEQARGEPATPASDRYALGVVAFELLTGRRPFAADTPTTELFAHLNADVPTASQMASDLPSEVDGVLSQALAKGPKERPRSCAELVRKLEQAFAVGKRPAPVETTSPTIRIARRTRRWRPTVTQAVGAAALLLAGLVVAALVSAAGGRGTSTQTVTRVETVVSTVSTDTTRQATATPDGRTLNEEGYAHMRAGDYADALPLLERSVAALQGTGSLDEAYADYNLAYTRFALGSCNGVLPLLDRSESIQGGRVEIDRLRREASPVCAPPGPGHGKGKGHGRGNGGDEG